MEHPLLSKIPGADAFCIALVMLLVCVPILPLCERLRPYQPPQVVSAPEVAAKVNDRIERASLRFTESLPWSCDQVRLFASTHTREEMLRLARRLTAEQRAEAMKCLREDKNA